MADLITVEGKVSGAEATSVRLLSVEAAIKMRLRLMLREAGREIQAGARGRAPHKTGALQKSIRVSVREVKAGLRLTVKPSAHYARFMEYGVVAHGTTGNRSLNGNKLSKVVRVRNLRARGRYRIAPHPFMAPAFDQVRGRIQSMIQAAVSEGIADGSA